MRIIHENQNREKNDGITIMSQLKFYFFKFFFRIEKTSDQYVPFMTDRQDTIKLYL